MRLGQDVEVFLQDNYGKHISAIGYINAGKHNPFQIPDMAKGFTLQEDGVALEFGQPPSATEDEWDKAIQSVMDKSLEYVKGLKFSNLSCTIFERDQMQDPAAHIFGCEPDYSAWTYKANPKPQPPHPFMRSAGGHIHVETEENPFMVGQAMDLFLGVPSVLMDKGEERKQMYGKAGAIRIKPYGVEYRVLSNYWALESKYRRWVWRATERALRELDTADFYQAAILDAINYNDKEAAQYLVEHLELELVA